MNALGFSPGERRGQAVEGEIFQSHLVQELQPVPNFHEDLTGDFLLVSAQFETAEKFRGFLDGEAHDIADILAGNLDVPRFAAQARAVALGAEGISTVAAEKNSHVQLVLLPFQVGKEVAHADIASTLTAKNFFPIFAGEVGPGDIERDILLTRETLHLSKK